MEDKKWSNLAKIVTRRTYNRNDNGKLETWNDTVDRVISGNIRNHKVSEEEKKRLRYYLLNRKATPAGRGLWFSGSPSHNKMGGAALNNCWFVTSDDWTNFVMAQDLLMLGGGVGLSIEHRFSSKLPKIKKNVIVVHKPTKDADFIVPDSREGWNELTYRVLESFFVTGKSFSYSTICIRDYGQPINGFGGTSAGAKPLIDFVDKLCAIFINREGKSIHPIDAADIICSIGEMVVSGNVRRSAIIILGDPWDKEYLKAKRWDIDSIPTYRALANYSVVCDDVDDLHPLYWKTYEAGEAFGIFNRKTSQMYGRMGEKKKDTGVGCNPCAEAILENGEPCNLQELFLPNLNDINEFKEAGVLMHRWGKRVTCEKYHNDKNDEVVKRNRRIGTGITGCLQSSELFKADVLDEVYIDIQRENISYSKELNIPESIRTTVIKPSGTLSFVGECTAGIHSAFSKYYIRRIRFGSNDGLIKILKDSGHKIEPAKRIDGSLDHTTLISEFYCRTPDGTPCADDGFDIWKQLDTLLFAQKHWADQSVSVTIYYKKDEINQIKAWLALNLKNIKTISFLCYNEHGYVQAPLEAITEEEYNTLSKNIKEIDFDDIGDGNLDNLECAGSCPIK
jgi:ribonucleoside-triphosphate reductase (thioredoxin)